MSEHINTTARHGVNIVLFKNENVLLLQNSDEQHTWSFPGGTYEADVDTDLRTTSIRETSEETGIVLSPESLVHVISRVVYSMPKKPHHSKQFTEHYYCAKSPVDNFVLSDEHSQGLWLPPHEARRLLLPLDHDALMLSEDIMGSDLSI